MQVVDYGGDLRKHPERWGHEKGQEGRLVNGMLMNGSPLWAPEAQPCWGLYGNASELPQRAVRKLGIYPTPVSLVKMASRTCS